MPVIELDEDNYEGQLKGTILLDFHAQWCGPCKRMSPHFKAASEEFKDQVVFAKVDVDELEDVASAFKIEAMPTLVFVKDGKPVANMKGYRDRDAIVKFVKDNLGATKDDEEKEDKPNPTKSP